MSIRGLYGTGQAVIRATLGDDQHRLGRIGLDLQPQPADLHIDRAVIDLGFVQARRDQQLERDSTRCGARHNALAG